MLNIEKAKGCTRLTINRPERKNALNAATGAQLLEALQQVEADPSVRCVVITGAGGTFSAGRDLREAASAELDSSLRHHDNWSAVFEVLQRLHCPSVAVVRGYAVAGGFTLTMGCDFMLAHRDAKFGALEMNNGFPAAVCTPLLANKAGPRLGLEFALFGQLLDAQRLHHAGLINLLAADDEELDSMEAQFVGRILALDTLAVRQTIETFRAARGMPISQAMTVGRHLNQLLDASGKFGGGMPK